MEKRCIYDGNYIALDNVNQPINVEQKVALIKQYAANKLLNQIADQDANVNDNGKAVENISGCADSSDLKVQTCTYTCRFMLFRLESLKHNPCVV